MQWQGLQYHWPLLEVSPHECKALLLNKLLNELRCSIVQRPVAGVQSTLA